jgi:glyoxylase-like metal-dependent hydrolase (beta-lactamase superfamily II)
MRRVRWSDPGVETVLPGVHRAPVPLPGDGLRAVSVYVIEDGDGVTLVDAGWDSPLARAAVEEGLAAAGAGVGDVRRVLVTHIHYDHVGQVTSLVRDGAGGYWMGEGERATYDHVTTDPRRSRDARLAELRGYGAGDLVAELAGGEDRESTAVAMVPPARWAADGDVHPVTDGLVRAIATPGHTRGHLCYLHEGRRLLFAGDHVLPHITPSIGYEAETNRLALVDYLRSLARVRSLEVDLVLPAHGAPFTDLAGRVDELTAHHDERLALCAAAVGDGPATAAAVARALPWTRRATPFDALDLFNRLLATWEAIAHLELLVSRGDLRREAGGDGVLAFRRA